MARHNGEQLFRKQTVDEQNIGLVFLYVSARQIDNAFVNGGLRVKVTPPIEFNDPFEAAVGIKSETAGRRSRPIFTRAEGRYDYAESPEIIARENIRAQLSHAALERVSNEYGLVCASLTPYSVLMWSHYAQSHRGFVIALDPESYLAREILFFRMVKYSRRRPSASAARMHRLLEDPIAENEKFFARYLLTKSRDWAYEYEMRAIVPLTLTKREPLDISKPRGQKGHFLWFNDESIDHVIAGWRMSDHDGERISRYVEQWPNVAYHRAIPNNDAFSLIITTYYQDVPDGSLPNPLSTDYTPPLARKR